MPAPVTVWRDRDGRLLRIRLARPKANVLDAEMMSALDEALAGASRNVNGGPRLRGVLIDHDGPHFSFGASVAEHLPEDCAAMLKGFHGLVQRVLSFPAPVLVAIRGQCLGGGLELASAGHVLFAAPDAKLGQPEISLGVFAPAATALLPERIGRAAAEDLLLSGRSIDGREAHRIGLVNAVSENPEAAALAYFDEHLANRSAASLQFAVLAARRELCDRVRSRLAALEELYLNGLMKTRDAVEGLTAFLEKRPVRWEDR
jgi:cyclohexa-1,5-dienecarbonyl-CoA hydratase